MLKIEPIIVACALLSLGVVTGSALAADEDAKSSGKAAKNKQADAGKAGNARNKGDAKPPLRSEKQKLSYSVGVSIARGLQRDGIDVDAEQVAAGVRDMLTGREPKLSPKQIRTALMQLQKKMQKERARQQKQQQQKKQRAKGGSKPGSGSPGEGLRNAALHGSVESIRQALENGADVNATGRRGQTPLMLAAYNGHTEIVKLLLENGARVRAVDSNGRTALMYASTGAFPETVKLLLKHDPLLDRKDNGEGFTALMFAAAEGNTEVARHLLEAGADPTVKDADGETALDFAKNNGHSKTLRLLKKHTKQN